jgi:hypothetical protein
MLLIAHQVSFCYVLQLYLPPVGAKMYIDDKPRAFLSYRHAESATDDNINIAHRAWVTRFAEDLGSRGIKVVWDQTIRHCLSKHSTINLFELPLCREISRAFPIICTAFVPIITPAYLERLGITEGHRAGGSIPYGVVFEERQGGGHAVLLCLSAMLPVVRAGRAHQLNMGYIMQHGEVIDFRGDDEEKYKKGLEKIVPRILNVDIFANNLSSIDSQLWCDTYIEWSRVKYPARARAPVDVWWFNTVAANEFLGEAARFLTQPSHYGMTTTIPYLNGKTSCAPSSRKVSIG